MKKSKKGASMIIALVFLLFCTFVGGSVLAQASANGTRISKLATQQDVLNQESAAMLMAEELRVPENHVISLIVVPARTTTQKVTILPGGGLRPDGPAEQKDVVYFNISADFELTAMQRIQLETAVRHYLEPEGHLPAGKKILRNFNYQGHVIDSIDDDFWNGSNQGTFQIQGTTDSAEPWDFADLEANYICGAAGKDDFDFDIDFGPGSVRKVHVDASITKYPFIHDKRLVERPDDGLCLVEIKPLPADKEYTVISWMTPSITKGGAGA